MPPCLLFITASVDHEVANKLLFRLREAHDFDEFRIVTRKDGLHIASTSPEEDDDYYLEPTIPPLQSLDNAWIGSTFQDIEHFLLTRSPGSALYIALDDAGVASETCVIGERMVEPNDKGEYKVVDRFEKMRQPWGDVYDIWVNLEVGNMGFEDFTDMDRVDEDGVYVSSSRDEDQL